MYTLLMVRVNEDCFTHNIIAKSDSFDKLETYANQYITNLKEKGIRFTELEEAGIGNWRFKLEMDYESFGENKCIKWDGYLFIDDEGKVI